MPPQPFGGVPHSRPSESQLAGVQHAPFLQIAPSAQQSFPHAVNSQSQVKPALQTWSAGQAPQLRAEPQPFDGKPHSAPSSPQVEGSQHVFPLHTRPGAQQVPPQEAYAQTHAPEWQVVFGAAQAPEHLPPQPSDCPQVLPTQFATQGTQAPATQGSPGPQQTPLQTVLGQTHTPPTHCWNARGQVPLPQVPPQPSGAPQAFPWQDGVQQMPPKHLSPWAQHAEPQAW